MSFRKRNVGLSGPAQTAAPNAAESATSPLTPGIRPSPLDGRPTTSTGTQTLDDLLGGHGGLALGNSLIIEENGTTDYSGALLKYYAAEGVVQGHQVHVVGMGEQWGRELPGLVGGVGETDDKEGVNGPAKEKMKIAWRYERLGEFGAASRVPPPTPNRTPKSSTTPNPASPIPTPAFTHTFDLTKRLPLPSPNPITHIPIPSSPTTSQSPYTSLLTNLTHSLTTTHPTTPHRLILPTLLSPALYPSPASHPTHLLPFLHSLRTLLRAHPTTLTAMLSLPLPLHSRSTGLTRFIESLSDGVIELEPFPHGGGLPLPGVKGPGGEENWLGLLYVRKVPVVMEKGGGGGGGGGARGGDDWGFSLSRRRFVVGAFRLPPVEGEGEGGEVTGGEAAGGGIEF